MSISRKIAGNTAVQVAGRFVGTLLGLFTLAVMTRHLGTGGFGVFSTAMSFLQFFGILVDFGLTLTMAKMIAEAGADESRVASNVFTLRLASAAVFFSIAPALALFFPYSADIRSGILVATFSFFFMALSQALVGVFQKNMATHLAAIAEVVGRAVLLALTLIAARAGAGLLAFMMALVLGNLVQFALTIAFTRKFIRLQLAFDADLWRKIISLSWPIGLSIAFNLIYLKGDIIILSLFRGMDEVGLYAASYKVLDVVTVIPMMFMGLVLPLLAASWSAGRKEEFRRRLVKSFDVLSLAAIPLAVGTFPVATDVMRLVGGPAFGPSGEMLAILMIAAACVFLASLFGHAVVAIGLQKPMVLAYAMDAAISLALYLYLVPRAGAIAAAWVTVFSEAFIMLACAAAVIAKTRVFPSWRAFSAAAIGSAVMYVSLITMGGLHVLVRIPLAMAVYGAVILMSSTVRRHIGGFVGLDSPANA